MMIVLSWYLQAAKDYVSSDSNMADTELIDAVAAVAGEIIKIKRTKSKKTKRIWVRKRI